MVYFVGAGTGAADLITVRGMRLLERADVIIYAGSLVNPELLSYGRPGCEIYDSSRLTLEEVMELMRRAEKEGKMTVRLHTGDPSIYGAVKEQMDLLDEAGIGYESCPGVTACFGAAAAMNLEFTLPGISQSLIITRLEGRTRVPDGERLESLASHGASMAVYLSAGMMDEVGRRLMAGGYGADTPAALVYKATWPEEQIHVCTVGTLGNVAREQGIRKTAVVLVGDVIRGKGYDRSRLYAPDFSTEFRKGRSGGDGAEHLGKVSVISFTERGRKLSEVIRQRMEDMEVSLYTKYRGCKDRGNGEFVETSVGQWTKAQMEQGNAMVFIGACGIAVRAAAPYLTDKLRDSPVVVMDEGGRYVIPVLSGHMGGANELACRLAGTMGAVPVITTATDINGKFAADLFAKRNGLFIVNRERIAAVSSKALDGKAVVCSVETGHLRQGCRAPEGVELADYPPGGPVDVVVTSESGDFGGAVLLRPREYVIGLGCRKGKEAGEIGPFILERIGKLGILPEQIWGLASISQKSREPGIVEWCRKERVAFVTYDAKELRDVKGQFHGSAFVEETVGVDNVCERAALKACGPGGRLVCGKQGKAGMTIAVARRQWMVDFEGGQDGA